MGFRVGERECIGFQGFMGWLTRVRQCPSVSGCRVNVPLAVHQKGTKIGPKTQNLKLQHYDSGARIQRFIFLVVLKALAQSSWGLGGWEFSSGFRF